MSNFRAQELRFNRLLLLIKTSTLTERSGFDSRRTDEMQREIQSNKKGVRQRASSPFCFVAFMFIRLFSKATLGQHP